MNKKTVKKVMLLLIVAIFFCGIGFLALYPKILFQQNEKKLENAAKRYFELNSSQLPTGERTKTVYLQELYHKSFIEEDIFIPYTKKTCSNKNSWVKVRKEEGKYKYYVYLDCGVISSKVDHIGPTIVLKGQEEEKINLGEEYKDPGVKSVYDDTDGKISLDKVIIKGNVDTAKLGTYEITYTASDSFSNKATIKRKINVIQQLNMTIQNNLNGEKNFKGTPTNNYLRLSNMDYRIFGLDDNNNVIVVADSDIANVNFSKLDDWLNYYYSILNDNTKKLIVKAKYCNMDIPEDNLAITECTSYTKNRNIYIPSIVEINKAANNTDNFMKTYTMSWTANKKNDAEAYLTRLFFFNHGPETNYLSYGVNDNYGVRPMFTIKGNLLIKSGDGSRENPYTIGDTKQAKGGTPLNERETGEYFEDSGTIWRIIKVEDDGTTKAISNNTLSKYTTESTYATNLTFFPNSSKDNYIYNPEAKENIGYFINNSAAGYVDTSKLVNHKIKVPIYKKEIIYKEEVAEKEYKTVLSAPDMYEVFSAKVNVSDENTKSYWLKNSSKEKKYVSLISDIGVPYVGPIDEGNAYGIRVVGYFKKDTTIISGEGNREKPYIIK